MTEATKKARKRKSKSPFSNGLLGQLLAQRNGNDAESLLGESGLIWQLKKQLAERMLSAELSHHLAGEAVAHDAGDSVLRLSDAGAQDYLYRQYHRKLAYAAAQNREESRTLSQR